MKKYFKRICCISMFLLSLISMTFFFVGKKSSETNETAHSYYYETDSSHLYNLFHSASVLDEHYNLTKHYPLINENQTNSSLCWIYASMKSLESSFMVQTGEYYNFSEVGQAYLSSKYFDYGSDYDASPSTDPCRPRSAIS